MQSGLRLRKRTLLVAAKERLARFEAERLRLLADLHKANDRINWEKCNIEQLKRGQRI